MPDLQSDNETGNAGVSDAETVAAEPGQSVAEPADRVMHPGTKPLSTDVVTEQVRPVLKPQEEIEVGEVDLDWTPEWTLR